MTTKTRSCGDNVDVEAVTAVGFPAGEFPGGVGPSGRAPGEEIVWGGDTSRGGGIGDGGYTPGGGGGGYQR